MDYRYHLILAIVKDSLALGSRGNNIRSIGREDKGRTKASEEEKERTDRREGRERERREREREGEKENRKGTDSSTISRILETHRTNSTKTFLPLSFLHYGSLIVKSSSRVLIYFTHARINRDSRINRVT